MLSFVQRHAASVIGVLSGFDRLVFRGTLLRIANAAGLDTLLAHLGVPLKEAGEWMQERSQRVKEASEAVAEAAGRPVEYLASATVRRDELAREIARRDGIQEGLVCLLKSVDPCWSFEIHRNRAQRKLELVSRLRKCLHYSHYYMHPQLGLMHMRLQSWFPFTLWSCLNGREWLCRGLDREKIGYLKRENCFLQIADLERAQALLDEQLRTPWAKLLEGVRGQVHPAHGPMWKAYPMDYYWSCSESEWATDVMFRSPQALAELYPDLIRHGMQNLGGREVLRFLGRAVPATGTLRFAGELVTGLVGRPEGMCLRHRMNRNSIKMYDKQGSVLRIETTINDPSDFKVYRGTEADPDKLQWRQMRKGVADLHRRAQVSQAANDRYLKSLAAVDPAEPLRKLTQGLCRPVTWQGQRARGLNPLGEDAELLEAVARGEFTINGFRNRDLRTLLWEKATTDPAESRRRSGMVTRKLRLLRAHGLIAKVPKTHRYVLSDEGRRVIMPLLAARAADVSKLMKAA